MKSKIHYLKDDEEVVISGKLLREHKRLVIKDFLDFHEFPDSNISGRMIVNPYWLEHLLNLFFQGYVGEVWEEIMDTEMNHCALIENWGYGIIGQEFNKKHLALSNSSPPVRTSNSTSLTSDKLKGFNMGLEVSATPTPKEFPSEIPSPNPYIHQNSPLALQSRVQSSHNHSHHLKQNTINQLHELGLGTIVHMRDGSASDKKGGDNSIKMLPLTLQSEIGTSDNTLIKGNLKN